MIVDVHSHLDLLEDVKSAIKGVIAIGSGLDHESNLRILELTNKFENVKACLGVYPIDALKLTDEEIDEEIYFIRENKDKIVGIGEIGLDFKESDNKERQVEVLIKIIKKLRDLDKVFVVHSRRAEKECVEVFEKLKVKKVVFHCFHGNFKLIKRIEKNGWMLSIPCIVNRSEHFQKIVETVDIKNLLVESDAPFLCAEAGKRNEPRFVGDTLKIISTIKKMKLEAVEEILFENYEKVFC